MYDMDRSIYRTIELADGWTGVIIQTQWIFSTAALLQFSFISISLFT